MQPSVIVRREEAIGKRILDSFRERTGIFTDYHSEATNDIGLDRDLYLNYVTFTCAIDYEKNMDPSRLWKTSKEWAQNHPWLYQPPQLLSKPLDKVLSEFDGIRARYSDVFRPKDIGVWLLVAKTLALHSGSTLKLLEGYGLDAWEIFNDLNGAAKSSFPFLSGDKTMPRWLRTLWEDAQVPLRNIGKVPLPVDRNTAQATYIILLQDRFKGLLNERKKQEIRGTWKLVADRLNVPVVSFDAPLRFIGASRKRLDSAANWLQQLVIM